MLGALAATLGVAAHLPAHAQTAPYLLPYTVSTFAGPHAEYSGAGVPCGSFFTLDTSGDGCLASQVSIGVDPHDVRVDYKGNLFFIDNTGSSGVIHKISPFNLMQTIYAGTQNTTAAKACTTKLTTYGDGCISTDGAANANLIAGSTNSNGFTAAFKTNRGLGTGFNGDVYIAGYNDDYDHRIAVSTLINNTIQYDYMMLVAGSPSGTTGTAGTPPSGGSVPVSTSSVNASRGISADLFGNVFVADTGNSILREESAGTVYNVTQLNSANTKVIQSNVPASSAQIEAPEDAQADIFGNIFIADFGNVNVRMIYNGGCTGTCTSYFGIPAASLTKGNIYWIAGYNAIGPGAPATATAYPKTGATPTIPATQVALTDRKISVDLHGDLYIADQSNNVIWFVDHATGYIRLLAGNYGTTQPTTGVTARGCSTLNPAGNTVGDGCAGSNAGFNFASSNSGVGSSPDNQGNLYVTDPEGSGNSAGARIRKILSGLNFPATATGASVTQSLEIHFAPNDTPAAAGAYTLTTNAADYALGTPACTVNADNTDDCVLPVTFTPTVGGPDNATLKVTSTAGGVASFILTGTGTAAAIAFDPGNTAKLATISNAQGIALDGAGNAYIADTGSNRVLFYNAQTAGTTVFAGTGAAGNTGNGGLATAATLNGPKAVAIGTDGSVYIADTGNNVIRKVSANGIITLFAGGGTVCAAVTQYTPGATDAIGDGCLATQATFSSPSGLAADAFGSIYVADTGNNLIRQIGNTGFVTVLAGGGTACSAAVDSNGDGCPATQTIFSAPTGLVYDPTGQNIVVADTGHSIVRKIYLSTTFTNTSGVASNIQMNPVTLIAGNGQAGSSVDANNVATASQLSSPTGVAMDASGTVYIADTGNSSVRMVTTSGIIATIAGITGAPGTGTVPASAIITQLTSPGAVAVLPGGTLYIADSGNNRLLSDVRSQITYNFGRTNDGFPSPVQNFTEINIGPPASSATLPSPLFTPTPSDSQLSLVAAANSNNSIAACASGTFASGAICNLQGQFNPTDTNAHSSTFNQTGVAGIGAAAATPSITLQGQGAVLTNTTSMVVQSAPATGNAQFGAPLTLTATVTATPNTADPVAYPTGNIIFIVDNSAGAGVTVAQGTTNAASTSATASQQVSGLAVGSHKVSCHYSGDFYYAGSVCTVNTITVVQASTTSMLLATPNNQPQFTPVTVTAQVTSNTVGIPTGNVTFYATLSGTTTAQPIGMVNLNSNGVAQLNLYETNDANGNPTFNSTLLPGTYSLTCTYNGATNYATSNCAGVNFTVTPQPQALVLTPRGCVPSSIYSPGTSTAVLAATCPYAQYINGVVDVAVAQGSTTDVTLFVTPTNTVSGTLTFSCTGVPAASTCTFSPTSIPLTAGTAYATPVYTDVTLWTDLQPGYASLQRPAPGRSNVALAEMIGWPLTLLGFLGVLRFRRRLHALTLVAVLMVMAGTSLTLSGCAGPGAYQAILTPAGTYPITLTVKSSSGVTQSTIIDFTVTSPGITGQQ